LPLHHHRHINQFVRVFNMSGMSPTKITVVYVATTGHVVAGFTRADVSGSPPKLADLVGDDLVLQMGATPMSPAPTPTKPIGRFLIPATDLALVDVDLPLQGAALWGQSVQLTGAPGSLVPGQPPALFAPTSFGSSSTTTPAASVSASHQLTVSFPGSTPAAIGLPYYVLVAQPITGLARGSLAAGAGSSTATTAVTISVPGSASGTTQLVLVLVQGVSPFIATLAV
jgi:hypothetical protein